MTLPALRASGIVFDPERPDWTRKALAPLVSKYCRLPGAGRDIHEDPRLTAEGWSLDDASSLRPLALERIKDLPDSATLWRISEHFETIWRGEPAENITRIVLSKMLDAIPNARPASPDAYVDAAVDVLAAIEEQPPYRGFAPPVVAAAARQALRTLKFCPSIAELHDLCVDVRAAYRAAALDVETLANLRSDAELVLLELGEGPSDGMDDTIPDLGASPSNCEAVSPQSDQGSHGYGKKDARHE
ncbi:Uncharacterised protein [Starkeya nomas]|uniref:Uncharacterized protein n=1 Tax=Starkeya nomas TaxID=2666134 RepID=A0A5S9P172_9HYPH|nr:hypothetical protein [Starkeya nomas]CAA0096890.1 Uncharacterised protein [Starkeya nomas]